MKLNIIVAMCQNNGIGYQNKLPWNFSCDMKYFASTTRGNNNNAIIMGRNTHESIGKILPNRHNIILSKSLSSSTLNKYKNNQNVSFFNTIYDAVKFCYNKQFDEVWVIGGESIYKQFLELGIIDHIYITEILQDYTCDTFFPRLTDKYYIESSRTETENNTTLHFKKYTNLQIKIRVI